MKTCNLCSTDKPLTEFHRKGPKWHTSRCKACAKIYHRQHYLDNKKRYYENVSKRKERNYRFIYDYLKDKSCVKCGESDPMVLQFDHLGDKKFPVAQGINEGYSTKVLQEEMDKCQILCANCHQRKTLANSFRAKFFGACDV